MDDEYLALQIHGLECRLQRGEHLQEGGAHLMGEYRKLKAAQGKGLRKPKKDHSAVDLAMAEQVAAFACPACGGVLKQTRSGSLRAVCTACDERCDFKPAKPPAPVKLTPATECRECYSPFDALNPDSGCGICTRCMRDLQLELTEPDDPAN
ncbi:hypothetical protein D3C81_919570 [compost metagenome]